MRRPDKSLYKQKQPLVLLNSRQHKAGKASALACIAVDTAVSIKFLVASDRRATRSANELKIDSWQSQVMKRILQVLAELYMSSR